MSLKGGREKGEGRREERGHGMGLGGTAGRACGRKGGGDDEGRRGRGRQLPGHVIVGSGLCRAGPVTCNLRVKVSPIVTRLLLPARTSTGTLFAFVPTTIIIVIALLFPSEKISIRKEKKISHPTTMKKKKRKKEGKKGIQHRKE